MKPSGPRSVSPDAQKVHDRLFNEVSKARAPRAASTSTVIRRRSREQQIRDYFTFSTYHQLGKRPAVLGAEVPSAGMLRMLSSESTTAEEEPVDRILDAGAKRLFKSEEGREKIRGSSFNNDEVAKTMLEAAKEALDEGHGEESATDSNKAKDACDKIKSGSINVGKLAERV